MADKQVKIEISADGAKAEKGLLDVTNAARGMRSQMSDLSNVASTLTGLLGAGGLVAALNSSLQAAVQFERAAVGLAVTARFAGAGMSEANAAAKLLTKDGLMSLGEASQGLQNLLSRGFSLEQAVTMMNRLKDSAAFNRQAHLEMGQAIVGATEGLKNENSVLVDNAGVTKNVSNMWKEYAAEQGKSVDKLTQSEKRHAEYNGILRETEGQIGNAARMTDTYSGAQSRLNQQMTEMKTVAGLAMIPALTGILNALNPIISAMRDFIGGIQMMAVSTAAFADKAAALFNLAGQKGLAKLNMADLKREWANIDAGVAEQKKEIFDKMTGNYLPDVGRDSGARRTDIVIPNKAGGKSGLTEDQRLALASGKADLKNFLDLVVAENEASLAGEDFGKIPGGGMQFGGFGKQNLSILGPGGIEAFKAQAETDRQAWIEQSDITYANDAALSEFYLQRKIEQERRHQNQKINIAASGFGTIANLADAFYKLSGSKNKAAFKAFQFMKAGETTISTASGIMKALDDQTAGTYWQKVAQAAAIAAAGAVQLSNIWSASDSGNSSISPPSSTVSGQTSPIITQPTGSQQTTAPSVYIEIHGNIVGEEKWVEERLAPTIRQLVGRNVSFGMAKE